MSSYRQKIVEMLDPDVDGLLVIDDLDRRGVLTGVSVKDLGVLVSGKPDRTDQPAYMRWYRIARKHGLDTSKPGVSVDRESYNRDYYRRNKGRDRGAQAWDMMEHELIQTAERLNELARYARRRADELRNSRGHDPEPPDSGSDRK
jgi:hypothetical protein